MPNKRALIVDDSKTAQFKLKKILSGFELSIDSVFSAEDALSYLSYQAPDIIFMDHSMKGMSGLEAVKIIKLNPVTAVIPIVMYTAEKGDVYVSQARAVGAMQVLSKDLMTQSDIEHVMKSANISEKEGSKESAKETLKKTKPITLANEVSPSVANKPREPKVDLAEVRTQVSRAIDLQHGKIQRDIQDSSRMITRRLMYEVNELHQALKQQNKKPSISIETFADLIDGIEPPKQRSIFWYLLPMLAIFILMIYGAYELKDLKRENRSLINANQEFAVALAQQNQEILATVETLDMGAVEQQVLGDQQIYDSVSWLVNRNTNYNFSEQAISAQLTDSLNSLVALLDKISFSGVISLEIHAGNFCIITNDAGQIELPSGGLVGDCQLLENFVPDPSRIEHFSLEFTRFLNTNSILAKGDIDIVVDPAADYTAITQFLVYDASMDAQEWNVIAAENNKVVIRLESY